MHLIAFVDLDITVAKTQAGLSGSLYVSLGGTEKEAHKEKKPGTCHTVGSHGLVIILRPFFH